MTTTAVKLGPMDHGRPMRLREFEHVEVQPGYLYELARGVIIVSDIPNAPHTRQLITIRRQLSVYELAHPDVIYAILGGGECKILVDRFESERHPDLAIYMTPLPAEDSTAWEHWISEIVIEIVSPDSVLRDYQEKPEEYLQFGVKEYWIFDAVRGEMHVYRRARGRWTEQLVCPPAMYRTNLLPGLEFACGPVFEAARVVAPRGKTRKKRGSTD